MYIGDNDIYSFKSEHSYMNRTASKQTEEKKGKSFMDSMGKAEKSAAEEKQAVEDKKSREEMDEELRRLDEELRRIREENKRERERQAELRLKKKLLQKKIMEKLALKKYLARQDEISQLNEKISLERAVGEDVYIEKAPLSKSLSVAEIMALCSGNL